jgi:8-oxo-dGTP diphosphatase
MKPVRNSIKAVIIREGKILLTVNNDGEKRFYLLPGGGQEPGETMEQALKRECLEEIGVTVKVGEMLWVREFLGSRYEWDVFHGLHQVEFMFVCSLEDGARPHVGTVSDTWQTGVEWVSLDRLPEVEFYPKTLKPLLTEYAEKKQGGRVYLGDVG